MMERDIKKKLDDIEELLVKLDKRYHRIEMLMMFVAAVIIIIVLT